MKPEPAASGFLPDSYRDTNTARAPKAWQGVCVSSSRPGALTGFGPTLQRGFEVAIARLAAFEGKAETVGAGARLGGEGRIVGLGLVDQFFVVGEVAVAQLRVTVEPERAPDEGIELPDQGDL